MTAVEREYDAPTQALPASLFQRHTLDAIDLDLAEIITRLDRVQAQLTSAEEHGYSLSGLVSAGQLLEACARVRTAALVVVVERSCTVSKEGL